MRLAFYYESVNRVKRNDGGPLYWWATARRLFGKDNAIHLIPDGNTQDFGHFDYHIWVDWGEDALMPNLPYKPVSPPGPSIYVTSDTHLGYDYRLSRARDFDWVFCNQEQAVRDFIRDGIPAERCLWLPHAAEPTAYPKEEVIKKYDVCFIGNVGSWNRVDFLDDMFKAFPNFFYGKRLFEEAAQIFNQSKIVLNISIKDDVNMRVFEALSTGSLLLTNELPSLPHLFKDGEHLVTYKDTEDAIWKARYYLEHEEEARQIAENGYKEFIKKHTYEHRLKKVLEIVEKNKVIA